MTNRLLAYSNNPEHKCRLCLADVRGGEMNAWQTNPKGRLRGGYSLGSHFHKQEKVHSKEILQEPRCKDLLSVRVKMNWAIWCTASPWQQNKYQPNLTKHKDLLSVVKKIKKLTNSTRQSSHSRPSVSIYRLTHHQWGWCWDQWVNSLKNSSNLTEGNSVLVIALLSFFTMPQFQWRKYQNSSLMQFLHRTKNQVSVNVNMVETRDSVAETQRQTRVSVSGYITVSHVSVAVFSREPAHFFTCFQQISVSGITYFRNH